MLYRKWVLISRSAELNEIARHASPHPKKTLEHTICLSKRIDADQRCGASDLHLEFKFAGVMTWSSGADLEATKRGSHRLRQAGRSCSLIGAPRAQPFDQVVLGLGATSLRKLSHQGESATVQGVPVSRTAAQKGRGSGSI